MKKAPQIPARTHIPDWERIMSNYIKTESFVQGHPGRHEKILRKVFHLPADMPVIRGCLVIEADEHVLRTQTSHYAFEQAGFAARAHL